MIYFSDLGRLISINERLMEMFYNRRLAGSGIGWGQQFYVEYICDHPGAAPQEMVKHIRVDKATLTKVIRKLLGLGLITVEGDSRDGRVKHLYPTEKAIPLAQKIKSVHEEIRRIISKDLPLPDLTVTGKTVDKINENIRTWLSQNKEA